MYYTIYANEALALDNWDYYNECNWLLTNFLAKDYRKSIDEKIDFYYLHRHERFTDEDSYVEFSNEELKYLYGEYQEYMTKKNYHELYMEDFYESGEDVENYESPSLAYVEWEHNDYMEKLSRIFGNKELMKKIENGEELNIKTYDWQMEKEEDMRDKFTRKIKRNRDMKTKLREINEVVLYKSDFDVIEKVRKEHDLTELQTSVVFGLIFMSRMNDTKWCRIGTEYKAKGFWSCFNKYVAPEDKWAVWDTGVFDTYKEKAFQKYENKTDKIYLNFDNKDEVAYVFKTTVENNKLNFSELAKEILPNFNMKYCIHCGKAFVPASNRQKQCAECKKENEKEQARIRKQRQRDREKGIDVPIEKKAYKRLTAKEREAIQRQESYEQQKLEDEKLLKEAKEKPWL